MLVEEFEPTNHRLTKPVKRHRGIMEEIEKADLPSAHSNSDM